MPCPHSYKRELHSVVIKTVSWIIACGPARSLPPTDTALPMLSFHHTLLPPPPKNNHSPVSDMFFTCTCWPILITSGRIFIYNNYTMTTESEAIKAEESEGLRRCMAPQNWLKETYYAYFAAFAYHCVNFFTQFGPLSWLDGNTWRQVLHKSCGDVVTEHSERLETTWNLRTFAVHVVAEAQHGHITLWHYEDVVKIWNSTICLPCERKTNGKKWNNIIISPPLESQMKVTVPPLCAVSVFQRTSHTTIKSLQVMRLENMIHPQVLHGNCHYFLHKLKAL